MVGDGDAGLGVLGEAGLALGLGDAGAMLVGAGRGVVGTGLGKVSGISVGVAG